jgi:hypothetical protein
MSQETMLFKVVVNILILAPSQMQSLCLGAQMNPTIFHLFNHCSTHNTFNNCHMAWLPQCIYERNYKGKSISLLPRGIHKSKAIMQVMQLASIGFAKFSMVLVTKACNISLID